jgi:putative peptide zinc metalloprotease protein
MVVSRIGLVAPHLVAGGRMTPREPLLSPDWYRVASMRPRLRNGVRVTRQQVRGETWYVLSDPVSGRHHRFNDLAYGLIAACDGQRTLDQVWASRAAADGDNATSQGEAIRVFSQAFSANLFIGDVAPDAVAIVRAQTRSQRRRRRAAINPLAFRVPLWDPDHFLDAHVDRVRGLFGRASRLAMALCVLMGALLLGLNADAVAVATHSNLSNGRFLLMMWLAYPLIKALHELGHAFAVKVYGGEVHEIGVTLLCLTPVPYVDASASAAFADKRQRVTVAAAGIAIEVLLASCALALWLALEPGLLREAAFAIVLVGGLSTLLVNANPLLRFDGYFILSDALELPNLAQRSGHWWQVLLRRRLLNLRQARMPGLARGERPWLLAYAPLSWSYRVLLMASLAVLLAEVNVLLGLAMLALGLWSCLLKPLFGAIRYLWGSPELSAQRPRAAAVGAAAMLLLAVLAFGVPLPHHTYATAVVWLPDDAIVRMGTDGFVEEFLVRDGEEVSAGGPLLRLSNDPLTVELERVTADLQRRDVERASLFNADAIRTALLDDEIARLAAERDRLQQRVGQLLVRAGVDGRVVLDPQQHVIGRYVSQGQVVAHVLPAGAPLGRAMVRNEDIALVRERPGPIQVTLAHAAAASHRGVLDGTAPQASTSLPTAALGEGAGGSIALDPADKSGRTAREARFPLDLRLPAGADAHIGARALVVFGHGRASAVELVALFVRRSFLRHFER